MPTKQEEYEILKFDEGHVEFHVVGTAPLIVNAMPQKVKEGLLAPKGSPTRVERAARLKHLPHEEFRASAYTLADPDSPTLLAAPGSWFKESAKTAALDMPGVRKTEIGRRLRVPAYRIPLYGEPQIFMSVVRSADMKHTPDVRTRCILPQWALDLHVYFTQPLLKDVEVVNLLAAAGMVSGVGDWRTEKGSGSYGSFRLAPSDDPEYAAITSVWGRQAQAVKFADPAAFDHETEELIAWFLPEAKRRGFKVLGNEEAAS